MTAEFDRNRMGSFTLYLSREEIPVFRALLDRASFVDTPPQMMPLVLDLIEHLREQLPKE